MSSLRYAFLGAGQMGGAILDGVLRSGLAAPDAVTVCDARPARAEELRATRGVRTAATPDEAVAGADVVVLAVKPQDLGPLLDGLDRAALARPTFLSIAAGKPLAWLEARLPGARVVRVMPNLAMRVGEGMSAFCPGSLATEEDVSRVRAVLEGAGRALRLEERHFDAVTALSGSGPAFLAVVLQAFVDGGVALGLAPEDARMLALQTFLGTAKVLAADGAPPLAAFVEAVTSAKGTTAAGREVLESSDVPAVVAATLAAAARRSHELER